MRIRSLPGTLVLAGGIVVAGMLAPVPALAKVGLQLTLPVGSGCLSGYKPNFDRIRVKLLRSDGTARETAHDDSANYSWALCFHHVPVAGNKLQMINGTDLDRTVTVPDLTLDVDRVASRVSGHGPAGKVLEVTYLDCYPSLLCVIHAPAVVINVNSHGRFHEDLTTSSIDIDGADEVNVLYQNTRGDRFIRTTTAPYFAVTKPDRVRVSCVPRGATTVRLMSSTGVQRATRTFHATKDCSSFSGSFRKDGHAVAIHAGDRVTSDLAADARLVWPTMSVKGSGDLLSGRCLANSRIGVLLRRGGAPTPVAGTTDADGHFSVSTPSWTFQPGDTLELICETSRGDRARMTRTL
jgi:hypothetical protein